MAEEALDDDYPCSLTLHIPFPTHRLASAALRSLAVDEELSPLVKRQFSLTSSKTQDVLTLALHDAEKTVLQVDYKATTPRMLRVAVNGFFESLGVIVQVMEELDVDVLHEKGSEDLKGVQGVLADDEAVQRGWTINPTSTNEQPAQRHTTRA